jgi:phosphatidylglycerol---prolipoprotein diacylglyceryl transferase
VIVLFFYARRHKLNFAEWTDIAAPGLALGQAIGRWGNFVNQELYGAPTNLPWKLYIDPEHRLANYRTLNTTIPCSFMNPCGIWEHVPAAVDLPSIRGPLKNGDIFLVYLVVYPVGRFLLDFLRLDASMVGGININQIHHGGRRSSGSARALLRHRPVSRKANPIIMRTVVLLTLKMHVLCWKVLPADR